MKLTMLVFLVPTLAIRITEILYRTFLSFFIVSPLCLEVNSNPSGTYRSKRVSMMIHIDG